tara:strand:+ start:194 stop:499 length:306 start_codon:yes stop_codon:yes gene_type:complete
MSGTKQSLMSEKGWHCEVSDDEIESAQKALRALLQNSDTAVVYYTEEPDPFSGKRYFWTPSGKTCSDIRDSTAGKTDIGCFDHYGNLVIYSSFLSVTSNRR